MFQRWVGDTFGPCPKLWTNGEAKQDGESKVGIDTLAAVGSNPTITVS